MIRKQLLLLSIISLFQLLASCTGDKSVEALLDRAEVLMDSCPDSAYSILQSVSSPFSPLGGGAKGENSFLSPLSPEGLCPPRGMTGGNEERGFYLLLLAEATNKLYKQMPSDTVFQDVVDYYDRHGNANQQMKAYYLMGCIYRDRHEAPMALQWYLNAIEKADTLARDCDYLAMMKIYGQMASIYHNQLMPMEEIEAYCQYSKYAEKANNTYEAIRGIEKQLNAYSILGDTTKILNLTDSVHDLYLQANMPEAAASVYPSAIYIYLTKKDYSKAKRLMDVYERQSGLFDVEGNIAKTRESYYCFKGMYYQGINKLDSAKYYYHRLIQYGYEMSAYNGLFSVYWKEQNMDSVAKYSLLYIQSVKDNAATQQQEAMVNVKSLYDYTRQQKIASQKEIELIHRTNVIIYIIIGVVIISALLFVWFFRNKRAAKESLHKKELLYNKTLNDTKALLANKERELAELSQQNLSLEELECNLRQEIADAKARIKALESSNSLQELLPHNQEEEMLANPIVAKFHQFATNTSTVKNLMPEHWNELNLLIENQLPRLYALIINDDRFTDTQKRLVFLVRLHFKNNEMINLLGLGSAQQVTNRIAKLNQILYGKKKARDFYNNLKNMLPR